MRGCYMINNQFSGCSCLYCIIPTMIHPRRVLNAENKPRLCTTSAQVWRMNEYKLLSINIYIEPGISNSGWTSNKWSIDHGSNGVILRVALVLLYFINNVLTHILLCNTWKIRRRFTIHVVSWCHRLFNKDFRIIVIYHRTLGINM